MLNLSNSFESVQPCPHRAKLVEASALFNRFFKEQGLETDISITNNTVKAYPVLFIKPAGQTDVEDLATVIQTHGDNRGLVYSATLSDVAVRVEDEQNSGFLMMAGMMIVQDLARAMVPEKEPFMAPSHAVDAPVAAMR